MATEESLADFEIGTAAYANQRGVYIVCVCSHTHVRHSREGDIPAGRGTDFVLDDTVPAQQRGVHLHTLE
jgi:hypothetical protein